MGLYERWTAHDESKIPVHAFAAACAEWARGAITRAQVISSFGLIPAEETELDAIKGKYDALANATQKAAYISKFHDVMLLSEAGHYDSAKAKTELGF